MKEYTVTQISSEIKNILEKSLSYIKVKGEISNLTVPSSGHAYFNLKDEKSVISCICWKKSFVSLRSSIKEGAEVLVLGKITTYEGHSKYQIIIDSCENIGAGALMRIFIERKKKFETLGYFSQSNKKQLPKFPKKIGIITSETGSVIRDIIHRIKERFPTNVILWPVSVQGENSSAEISFAIKGFNDTTNPVDLLIIARGGGSIEDLWSFNEENVIIEAFNSKIPIISAIGHETDFTLLDFVSDLRAPTPTAAAELCTPVISEIKAKISDINNLLKKRISYTLDYKNQILISFDKSSIVNYDSIFYKYDQKFDNIGLNFTNSKNKILDKKNLEFLKISVNTNTAQNKINTLEIKLSNINLARSFTNHYQNFHQKFTDYSSKVSNFDVVRIMKMGFAVVKSDNNIVKSIYEIDKMKKIDIVMIDGKKSLEI